MNFINSGTIPIVIFIIILIIYYLFKPQFDKKYEEIKYYSYYQFLRIKNILF